MLFSVSRNTLWVVSGVAGTLFIGYCFYFDKKRRMDPEYKKKVRERRLRQYKEHSPVPNMSELTDYEKIQTYFLQQIQIGESLIGRGETERGVEYIANGILVCSRPGPLLRVLQSSLPSAVFALLIIKMQEQGGRYFGVHASESNDSDPPSVGEESIERERNISSHSSHYQAVRDEVPMTVDDLE